MNLRKYAQGKPCMIRLPGCLPGDDTVVLCHWRDSSTGMGQKENDLIGAWGCASCHDIMDGRKRCKDGLGYWSGPMVREEIYKAIIRTQQQLIRDGVFKIK